MPTHGLGVVLDPHRGGLGGAQRVDAEQERQRTVVNGDGRCDLEEPDQLEPVQPVSSGLVALDLGQARVDRRIRGDQSVYVGEAEEAAHRVHHRHD